MTERTFDLSKKIKNNRIKVDDFREFVKWLKMELVFFFEKEDECEIEDFFKIINRLAGNKLVQGI